MLILKISSVPLFKLQRAEQFTNKQVSLFTLLSNLIKPARWSNIILINDLVKGIGKQNISQIINYLYLTGSGRLIWSQLQQQAGTISALIILFN